jgi:hypothetical protein
MNGQSTKNRRGVVRVVVTLLLAAALGAQSLFATTYIAAEVRAPDERIAK